MELLATPLHLLAGLNAVHCHPAGPLTLAEQEWDLLSGSLADGPLGEGLRLQPLRSDRARLFVAQDWQVATFDPAPLAGRDPGPWLPAGRDGAALRRLMTELQMWLHDHPLNERRAARGEPALNALWLWQRGLVACWRPRIRRWRRR